MRTTSVIIAVVALLCAVGGAHAELYGVYGYSPVPGAESGNADAVYMNITFTTNLPAAHDSNNDMAIGDELVNLVFAPYFAVGGSACQPGSPQMYFADMDLSHLNLNVVGLRVVSTGTELVFYMSAAVTPQGMPSFDIEALPHQVNDCLVHDAPVAVPSPSELADVYDIVEYTLSGGVVGLVDGSRNVGLPNIRGLFYTELEFTAPSEAAYAAAFLTEDLQDLHAVQPFLQCLANALDDDPLGDYELPFWVNDTHILFAEQLPPPMDTQIAVKFVIDYFERPREWERWGHLLAGDHVKYCTYELWTGMDIAGNPTFPGFNQLLGFNSSVLNYTEAKYNRRTNRSAHRVVTVAAMTQSQYDSWDFSGPTSAMLSHELSNVMNEARVDPSDEEHRFSPAHVDMAGASFNGTHAIFMLDVYMGEEDSKQFADCGGHWADLAAAVENVFNSPSAIVFNRVGEDSCDDGGGGGGNNELDDSQGFIMFEVELQSIDGYTWMDADRLTPVFAEGLRRLAYGEGSCVGCDAATEAECRPGMEFNIASMQNSSRYEFEMMAFLDATAVSSSGAARFLAFVGGNEEEARAYFCRVKNYDLLTAAFNAAACPTGSPGCTPTANVIRDDRMGRFFQRGAPGGAHRNGATAVFRVYGLPTSVTADSRRWKRMMETSVSSSLTSSGHTGIAVNVVGCVDSADVPYRVGVTCKVQAATTMPGVGETGPERDQLAADLFMAIDYAGMGTVALEWAPHEDDTTWKVNFVFNGRAVLLEPHGSQFTTELQAAAAADGATEAGSYMFNYCVNGPYAVCSFEFVPEASDEPQVSITRLENYVTAAFIALQPSLPPALQFSDNVGFHRIDPCWACVSGGHGFRPDFENGFGEELKLFFRNRLIGDFDPEGAAAINTNLAMHLAAYYSARDSFDWLKGVGFNGTWLDVRNGGDEVEFSIQLPDPKPDNVHERLTAERREINNQAAKIFNNITGLNLEPQCQPRLFKYQANGVTSLATDECHRFFMPADCDSFVTVNSQNDGSGMTYWIIPDDARSFDSSGMQECGCDTQGGGCNNNGGPNRRRLSPRARRSLKAAESLDAMTRSLHDAMVDGNSMF